MLVPFSVQGKAGLRFSSGEIALPALYDATWRISPHLYGFRAGEQYGLLSPAGRQVHPCTLPALFMGFREVTAATVLDWVTQYGIGQSPPLHRVLGRLCHADVLWAEEVTPQLWRLDELRHVLPSGELVHITSAHQADTRPAVLFFGDATAMTHIVPVLTESTHLLLVTQQQWMESATTLGLPEILPAPAEVLNPEQIGYRGSYGRLRALLTLKARRKR